jgi:hypothetical protein
VGEWVGVSARSMAANSEGAGADEILRMRELNIKLPRGELGTGLPTVTEFPEGEPSGQVLQTSFCSGGGPLL